MKTIEPASILDVVFCTIEASEIRIDEGNYTFEITVKDAIGDLFAAKIYTFGTTAQRIKTLLTDASSGIRLPKTIVSPDSGVPMGLRFEIWHQAAGHSSYSTEHAIFFNDCRRA